jgi:hypothetical protein
MFQLCYEAFTFLKVIKNNKRIFYINNNELDADWDCEYSIHFCRLFVTWTQ